MLETSLYPAVKQFLEAAGFRVKGGVHGCDAVAVSEAETPTACDRGDEARIQSRLVLQAEEPMRSADEVRLAVPATRRGCDRDTRIRRLGLMAVHVGSNRVEVLAEPRPYRPRPDQRRRTRLLSEHARRSGDPSPGGSSRQPIMTAYRRQALACAAFLQAGPARPRGLRAVAPEAGRILLHNVYSWFERTDRGVYRLNSHGEAALLRWPQSMLSDAARRAERAHGSGAGKHTSDDELVLDL